MSDLIQFLATRDEPCPSCGYNLRGLTSQACPECGEALELRVNLVTPRLGTLVVALGGYWATLGAAGALLIGMAIFTVRYGPGPGSVWAWISPAVIFALALAPAVSLTRRAGRLWMRKLGPAGRIALACSGWLHMAAGFTWFMWIVMTM
jgi:hypothetical protein